MERKSWKVPVWTFLRGDMLRKKEGTVFPHEDNNRCHVEVPVQGDLVLGLFGQHEKFFEHHNVFVFEGLVPTGGLSRNAKRVFCCEFDEGGRMFNNDGLYETRKLCMTVHYRSAFLKVWGDFPSNFMREPLRAQKGDTISQTIYRQVLAFPKGDCRGCILTFDTKSLRPVYRVVKSLPLELLVETATSF